MFLCGMWMRSVACNWLASITNLIGSSHRVRTCTSRIKICGASITLGNNKLGDCAGRISPVLYAMSITFSLNYTIINWWTDRDLNPNLASYEDGALTIMLSVRKWICGRIIMMPPMQVDAMNSIKANCNQYYVFIHILSYSCWQLLPLKKNAS